MSMLNLRGKNPPPQTDGSKPALPRAANVEPPPPPRQRNYSPEALNFAQRIIDDQAEIERLKLESDNWRSRALAAEEQTRRFEMRIEKDREEFERELAMLRERNDRELNKLAAQRQSDVDRLTEDRDFYKLGYARTRERLHVAGKVILDTLEEDKTEKPPPKVNLAAIAEQIETTAPTMLPAPSQPAPENE